MTATRRRPRTPIVTPGGDGRLCFNAFLTEINLIAFHHAAQNLKRCITSSSWD